MLRLNEVTKVFNRGGVNEKRALHALSLTLAPGDFVTVIGSNGAGKSTMLNAVAGSFSLDGGKVYLAGEDITESPGYKRAALIGRVFQDPTAGTAPSMTIEENLSIAAKRGKTRGLRRAVSQAQRTRMRDELSRFGLDLERRLTTPVGLLSGGQRQALTLLMAVFSHPRLLLLDEHTASLDPKTGERVLELTERLVESAGLTTLMVTHNIADSLRMGNRTVMMHEGRIVFDVQGETRRRMSPRDVLRLFEENSGKSLDDDRMLLTGASAGG